MNISNSIDVRATVHDWFQNARERRELLAMDDRMLRDIGITRADARRLAEDKPRRLTIVPRPAPEQGGPPSVDPALIQDYIHRAHVLRARAMGDLLRSIGRWFRGGYAKARIRKLAPVAR
jgi:uncharacterized protein YjiS (DUF1127 family)